MNNEVIVQKVKAFLAALDVKDIAAEDYDDAVQRDEELNDAETILVVAHSKLVAARKEVEDAIGKK